MAQRSPIIDIDEVPLNEARRMSRGLRMTPELSHALKEKIESLDNAAARLTIPEGTNPTTMKNRILRVASEKFPEAWSSGTRPMKIANKPQRSLHGFNRLGSHNPRRGEADADVDSAVRQRQTLGALGR
jgi:hypothetical protein